MIYLDNAATTKTCDEAIRAMTPYMNEKYGNPSSAYEFGNTGKEIMEDGRKKLARIINCSPEEIYYTSGGTESDNFAIKQVPKTFKGRGRHIITTGIEHHAILHSCQAMEREGFRVTYLGVDRNGRIRLNELINAISNETVLISVMHANNEIGTIEPIAKVGEIARKMGVLFHTDAVQSFCHIPIDVKHMNIDILSASSHKFHGPKGVGFMYVRDGVKINPFMDGGSQEKGLRAGTGNVPGVVGMVTAATKAHENMRKNVKYVTGLRDYFTNRVMREISGIRLNGHPVYRLPNNINISIKGVDGAVLMVMLDLKGICVSTGSACTQNNTNPSHVLLAAGLSEEEAGNSIRITLSEDNTKEEIDYTINVLKEEIKKLRDKA